MILNSIPVLCIKLLISNKEHVCTFMFLLSYLKCVNLFINSHTILLQSSIIELFEYSHFYPVIPLSLIINYQPATF